MEDNKNIEIQDNNEKNQKNASIDTEVNQDTQKQKGKKQRHAHEKALEEEQKKYNELNDKYLRLFSEFDNYRKRTAKEKVEMSLTASESVIIDLLPILDDFERALNNMEKNGNENDYKGVALIYNKLKSTLQKKGLEEIQAMDADFNTDEHEALTNIPAPDESKKGKVLDVVQKGYRLNGKVIRFARVVVGN
jgi:Molecular chaperone GrpE (heat shock protein)